MDAIQIQVKIPPHAVDAADASFSLLKPDKRCSISPNESGWLVEVTPRAGGGTFPVDMQFTANVPIVALGFAETSDVPQYTQRGSCGGCFILERNIAPASETTPLIRNEGRGKNAAAEYHFMLWVETAGGFVQKVGIDPQIYNEGVGEPPSLLHRLLRPLRRLWAWLRSTRPAPPALS